GVSDDRGLVASGGTMDKSATPWRPRFILFVSLSYEKFDTFIMKGLPQRAAPIRVLYYFDVPPRVLLVFSSARRTCWSSSVFTSPVGNTVLEGDWERCLSALRNARSIMVS